MPKKITKKQLYNTNRLKFANELLPIIDLHYKQNDKDSREEFIQFYHNNYNYRIVKRFYPFQASYLSIQRKTLYSTDAYRYEDTTERKELYMLLTNESNRYKENTEELCKFYLERDVDVDKEDLIFSKYCISNYEIEYIRPNCCNICNHITKSDITKSELTIGHSKTKKHKEGLERLIEELAKISKMNIDVVKYIFKFL